MSIFNRLFKRPSNTEKQEEEARPRVGSDSNLSEIVALAKAALENTDEYRKFVNAEKISGILYPKYKFSEYGRLFLEDTEFQAYYAKFMDANNWHSLDRKYVLREFLKQSDHVKGEFAECGVYQGATAYLLCAHGTKTQRHVYLFDSFQGISEPKEHDGTYWTEGALSADLELVNLNLAEFDNYTPQVGWIPECFLGVSTAKFSFVHVDVDLYEPTRDSVEYFYSRLNSGGIMLFDDYGFKSCPGAKKAIDEFFDTRLESVINLPTGQAFVTKL